MRVIGNTLHFGGKTYRCAIGKGGFSANKKEGDGATPLGIFALRECWYRADKMAAPITGLPLKIIQQNDGWCDDPQSPDYNRHIKVPPAGGGDKGGEPHKEWELGEGPHSTRQPEALQYAKELRHNLTKAEKKLWYDVLAGKQMEDFKFRKQMPVGPYIADFACIDKKLIIEIDGGQHSEAVAKDEKRTAFLEQAGYRVVRFWNNEVLENLEGVAEAIRQYLQADTPPTPPLAGGTCSYENLWRQDDVYDLIVPMGYNDDPVTPGRGSAIFMHVAKGDYAPTEGCIALAKSDLAAILPAIDSHTKIHIQE